MHCDPTSNVQPQQLHSGQQINCWLGLNSHEMHPGPVNTYAQIGFEVMTEKKRSC